MRIRQFLTEKFSEAMVAAGVPGNCSPAIAASSKPQFGDYQANGAMAAAKQLKTRPRDLAQKIVDNLDLAEVADRLEIAGPGFINIHLRNEFLAGQLEEQNRSSAELPQTVVVDYSGPNLAKEMHVGHLRSTIIGDAVARILEYLGHNVIRQNHMGDWGTQFGMLIAELEEHLGEGESADLALTDLEVFYQQAKRHFDDDSSFADKARSYVVKLQSGDSHCRRLWKKFIEVSVAHNLEIYRLLNVSLTADHIYPESAYNDELQGVVDQLVQQNIAVRDQGALVVYLDELAGRDGQPSPMIVQKRDGGFLYATTDLAALKYRSVTLGAQRILYFIDARQSLHMQQVFAAGRRAGFVSSAVRLEHLAFGTMMGKDGKPFKTRTGGTVKLAELLREAIERAGRLVREKNPSLTEQEYAEIARKVGIGAVKYADLSKTRTTDYVFDWDAMLSFEGNTAPYLQYAYTRIRSIFRKADVDPNTFKGPVEIHHETERALALCVLQFDDVVAQIADDCYPHVLCSYLYELASAFMSFYENCPILKEDVIDAVKNQRLQLAALTADTLRCGLSLLGIDVMEKM